MKKIFTAIVTAILAGAAQGALITYENTISSPADGGAGPALWFKSGAQRSSNDLHILNSGSAGALDSTHQAQAAGQALHEDLWGNANMAFGTTSGSASVAGSTGLFATGAQGTVGFLFKTGASIPAAGEPLFQQGGTLSVELRTTGVPAPGVRITYTNDGTKYASVGAVTTDTWYFFAMKWDTSKTGDDLTWYLGEENGPLQSGTLTIDSAGGSNQAVRFGHANLPMQQVAVWERELSDESIQAQFAVIPEPSTLVLFGVAAAGLLLVGRRASGGKGARLVTTRN